MKRLLVPILCLVMLIGIVAPAAASRPCPSLPTHQVTGYIDTNHWVSSYLWVNISGAGELDGKYDAYCIDIHRSPIMWENIDVQLTCSYDLLPSGTVDKPGNFDLANWILNYIPIGQDAGGGLGVYSWADVQISLWRLLENAAPDYIGNLDDWTGWTEAKVAQIIELATANGEGFSPAADQIVGILVIPVNDQGESDGQISLIWVRNPIVVGGMVEYEDVTSLFIPWILLGAATLIMAVLVMRLRFVNNR